MSAPSGGRASTASQGPGKTAGITQYRRSRQRGGCVRVRSVLPNEFFLAKTVLRKALQRVAEASVKVLGATGKVVHELLGVGVDFLRFAPIPALEEAARTLLNIWDSLQLVDVSPLCAIAPTVESMDSS